MSDTIRIHDEIIVNIPKHKLKDLAKKYMKLPADGEFSDPPHRELKPNFLLRHDWSVSDLPDIPWSFISKPFTIDSDKFRGMDGREFKLGWWVFGETSLSHTIDWFQIRYRPDNWVKIDGRWYGVHVEVKGTVEFLQLCQMAEYQETEPTIGQRFAMIAKYQPGKKKSPYYCFIDTDMIEKEIDLTKHFAAIRPENEVSLLKAAAAVPFSIAEAALYGGPIDTETTGLAVGNSWMNTGSDSQPPDGYAPQETPNAVLAVNFWHCDCGHDNDPNVSPMRCGICRRYRE